MNTLIRHAMGSLLLLALTACGQSQTLSPPPGGEQVSITVKVPPNLTTEPMRVMYRFKKYPIKEDLVSCGVTLES